MSNLFKLPPKVQIRATGFPSTFRDLDIYNTLDGQDAPSEVTVFFANSKGIMPKGAEAIGGAHPAGTAVDRLNAFLTRNRFNAAKGEIMMWSSQHGTAMIVGVTDGKKTANDLRALGTKVAKALNDKGFVSATIITEKMGQCVGGTTRALTYGIQTGVFTYSLKSKGDAERKLAAVELVPFMTSKCCDLGQAIGEANAAAEGASFMRQLILMPPNILGTKELTAAAQSLTDLNKKLSVDVLFEDELERLGFGSLLAVGRASVQKSYVVVLRYEGDPDAPLQALVGKGLVFDSGGINIKTDGGKGMKGDMGGAALVLGTVYAAAASDAKVNLVAVIGCVENAIAGNAYRPDDVLTSLSGKTIEVTNTDAEGRLVLADCLTYVERTFKPASITSFATLTGHAVIASGKRAPIFSKNDKLADAMTKAAETTGEMVLRFPLDEYLWAEMSSRIADMINSSGNRMSPGHVTAALFLNQFVEKTPYLHVDIAGASDLWGPDGGQYGVRMTLQFLKDLSKK
ncbi:MAG: leucyl aminopeptidase [Proteobacteria bacterium]|nr:leucyl aminopeptidase [Pseudomonadota bacterium]